RVSDRQPVAVPAYSRVSERLIHSGQRLWWANLHATARVKPNGPQLNGTFAEGDEAAAVGAIPDAVRLPARERGNFPAGRDVPQPGAVTTGHGQESAIRAEVD